MGAVTRQVVDLRYYSCRTIILSCSKILNTGLSYRDTTPIAGSTTLVIAITEAIPLAEVGGIIQGQEVPAIELISMAATKAWLDALTLCGTVVNLANDGLN